MDIALKRAIEFQQKGDLAAAIDVLDKAVLSGSASPKSYYFLGVLLDATGKPDLAVSYLRQSVQLSPEAGDFWFSYGNVLNKLGEIDAAYQAFEKCVKHNPEQVQALVNLALVAQRVDHISRAVECARKAVELEPKEKKAWLTLIGSLGHARTFAQGEATANEAEKLFPGDFEILHMKGNIVTASGNVDRGYAIYLQALERNPNAAKVLNSIGDYISQNRNGRDAIPYHQKVLDLDPKSVEALRGLGSAYLKAGSPSDAVQFFLKAIQNGYQNVDAFEGLLLSAQYLDDADEKEIYDLHRKWALQHAQRFYPTIIPRLCEEVTQGTKRIRMGFISPDFRNHSVARFMTALLRHTEMSGMDVYCYSDIKETNDFTSKLEGLGGKWIYSYQFPDEELAKKIKNDQIDVLVDLAGHTGNNRLLVFARKPAPIQISWLGYPNTTGLNTIDYRLSDQVADPVGVADDLSTEIIVRMDGGFHCFEAPIDLPGIASTPALKNGYLTFGSFNNQSKINLLTIKRWAGLLNVIPDSRIILKNHQLSDSRNQEHWRKIFENEGIARSRIEFIGFCKDLREHYDTYARIDIGLDTFPYNGTTTTCEALWMGVPVMTITGHTQRGRTGCSLLTHAGLEDWIAQDEAEWRAIATDWNNNRSMLNECRLGLRSKVKRSPIGNAPAFAEKFYAQIKELVASSK